MRNVTAQTEPTADGTRLTVQLFPPWWGRWLFQRSGRATRTFELDSVGSFVWDCCDGQTTVKQIIHRLAEKYNLNLREAEVSTLTFLMTLARKGLIGLKIEPKRAPGQG